MGMPREERGGTSQGWSDDAQLRGGTLRQEGKGTSFGRSTLSFTRSQKYTPSTLLPQIDTVAQLCKP